MADERRFTYGFRPGHCAIGTLAFVIGAAFAIWRFTRIHSMAAKVIDVVIGALMLYMALQMVAWWISTARRRYEIVVGDAALRAPVGPKWPIQYVDVPYASIAAARLDPSDDGKLAITYAGGSLEIRRRMVQSDEEFTQLVGLVQSHVKAAKS